MSLFRTVRKTAMTVAALAALAVGGAALANAATTSTNGTNTTPGYGSPGSGPQGPGPQGSPGARRFDPNKPGGHVGANGKTEAALPADVAAKVEQAARAKVPGGTVERVETDVDYGSPYEAHIRKSDGTEVAVLVNKDFTVTAIKAMGQR